MLLTVGVATGPLYDAGYFRHLLLAGSFLLVFGQMMVSLCHAYWQVLLAQAFCIGVGTGCLFIPSVAILSTYFSTKIGLAIGIAASGSSLGGVIYPIVFHNLIDKIGFGWTTRVLAFLVMATMIVPNVCMRVRVLPAAKRALFDPHAFKIRAYSLQIAGFFLGFMGLYMPFFYAQVFAIKRHITDENLAFYLIAIMNGTSVFGRKHSHSSLTLMSSLTYTAGIVPNIFADKVGPFNVVVPCALISALLCLCFMAATNAGGIVVLVAFYGFFSGSFVSLPPTIVVNLSMDAREKIGTRLGQSFAIVAFGVLIGTPIGGAVEQAGGFDALWAYGAVTMFVSAIILAAARITWVGMKIMQKA